MLPSFGDDLKSDFTQRVQTGKTHRLNSDETILGKTDGLDAVRQAVFLILNTERYEHEIYSWNYGVELCELIGRPIPLVYSLIKQRICEALIQDDRIISVDGFSFENEGSRVQVSFTVGTIYGEFEAARRVEI